jgi:hypothetical protein
MPDICKAILLSAATLAASGCMTHGPGGVAYSTDSQETQTAVGGTAGTGGGAVTGGSGVTPGFAPEKKEERGTPPVGTSRDGAGPAAGAIVDPTGAATRGRPY